MPLTEEQIEEIEARLEQYASDQDVPNLDWEVRGARVALDAIRLLVALSYSQASARRLREALVQAWPGGGFWCVVCNEWGLAQDGDWHRMAIGTSRDALPALPSPPMRRPPHGRGRRDPATRRDEGRHPVDRPSATGRLVAPGRLAVRASHIGACKG